MMTVTTSHKPTPPPPRTVPVSLANMAVGDRYVEGKKTRRISSLTACTHTDYVRVNKTQCYWRYTIMDMIP